MIELSYFILRIFIAGVCGAIIGYERMQRTKDAGMRTHCLVACGAALMMIISKYGFFDIVNYPGIKEADPSRIASQIVSGIGFLGAGMIFVHKKSIKGLTTAAGIWTTAGIGMAAGSGMYALCIIATLLILIIQTILKLIEHPKKIHSQTLIIDGVTEENFSLFVHEKLSDMDIFVEDVCVSVREDKKRYEFKISIPENVTLEDVTSVFEYDSVVRVNY